MCVILFKPIGQEPLSKEWLATAYANNKDGWGLLARSQDGTVEVFRGFDQERFVELGSSFGKDLDVVAHARIATGGKVNVANCHPFEVYQERYLEDEIKDKEPQAWLFHNGMVKVPEWNRDYSDTWHLARMWETMYGPKLVEHVRHRGWRKRTKRAFGDGNKFVVVTKGGVTIVNPNAGVWINGCWHSNKSAVEDYYYYGGCYGWDEDDTDWTSHKTESGVWRKNLNSDEWYLDKSLGTSDTNDAWKNGPYVPADFGADASGISEDEHLLTMLGKEKARDCYHLIDEWQNNPRVDDIEETIYNYDASTVAEAIKYLIRRAGV